MASEPVNPLATGVTAELYKAAIGPEGQDYYLRHFLKFDADGKTSATWHWPAYWATFGWLVFRKMWSRALVYAVALLGLALMIFGVGKLAFSYSDATALMLFLLFLTVAFVLPGLYANAWYYTDCSKKISAALRNAATVKEACEALSGQASTRRRMAGVAAVNAAALALVAGGVNFVQDFGQGGVPLAQTKLDAPAAGDLAVAAQPALAAASMVVPEPQSPPASQPASVASDPASPASPQAATEELTAKVAQSAEPVSTAAQDKPVVAVASASTDEKPKAANATHKWFVQVGAFAKDVNAQNVRTKVEALGLPSAAEPSDTPAGRLIRVRAGPFDSKGEAEKAALQIKALELPAVLVRQ
ncbi:SPOR domain-containing protein [Rhodoferax sp.]|uniref:SPOR domain-containing protein n=1 Tax=Rhodoferax sp. TaxID=50421 RepID=UPI002716EBD2|nr:SPOR domain-containing protein [Rhodoferax sp.]MDO9196095.1 SPOR domain-containing protein [Rhodoferax sp.]